MEGDVRLGLEYLARELPEEWSLGGSISWGLVRWEESRSRLGPRY